ncbi:hypothetical protein BJY22_002562 [Kribbella shirazensis]|uniref:Uncharacterized protein n=1 Tax=Kribbella shirazensis TaxID=1105143 RepID=A0A7X5V8Y1_9ACTN|nr:hypothetical protein [Kribbella shirazensis]
MPEKVRVSPAPASQLSTGGGQAALVPEDDELLEDELDDEPDVPEEPDEPVDDDPEDDPEEDDDSDFAGTELLPDDRLSVR